MSMFNEMLARAGLEFIKGYTVVNYDGRAIYVEGVSRVLQISADKISLDCNKHVVTVCGSDLIVCQAELGSITIRGAILSISQGDGND